ncbi:MAG: hypothetical protein OEL66_04255, partial [Desulfobulbaceae bacterium]|nr:hypothetical protein [Desulfobulbaceae bacterium]
MTRQSSDDTFGTISIADEAPDATPPAPSPTVPAPPGKTTRSRFWLLLVPAILFLCYMLGGFVLLPYLARTALPDQIAKRTNRPVTIGGADFNPFTMTLTLHNGIVGPDLAVPEDPVDP